MNAFLKGVSTIGNLNPRIEKTQEVSIQNSWKKVANSFYRVGKNLQWAIDETGKNIDRTKSEK